MNTRQLSPRVKDFLEEAHEIATIRAESGDMDYEALVQAGAAAILAADNPVPVHPLGAPVIDGTKITVDLMLNNPTRITKMVMDLSLQRFVADRIFASGGGVQGGAVIFDSVEENELYLERDVEMVQPGDEFPLIDAARRAPGTALVEKWGGKTRILDEAKDRNNSVLFTNKMRQLTNTIIRKINQRAIDVLEAAVTTHSRSVVGLNWSLVVTGGSSQSNADQWPARDFALATTMAEQDELGISYDLWILNPLDYMQLVIVYGGDLDALLSRLGYELYVSNRVAAGSSYVVAQKQVGQMRVEKPLGSETWRDPDHEATMVQSSVRPLMFVDNAPGLLKFTGLAG